jgi:hypothetical protein
MPKPKNRFVSFWISEKGFAFFYGSMALCSFLSLFDLPSRLARHQKMFFGSVLSPLEAWIFYLSIFAFLALETVKQTKLWLRVRSEARCEGANVS